MGTRMEKDSKQNGVEVDEADISSTSSGENVHVLVDENQSISDDEKPDDQSKIDKSMKSDVDKEGDRNLMIVVALTLIARFGYNTYQEYKVNPAAFSSVYAYFHSSRYPDPPPPESARDNENLKIGDSALFTNGLTIKLDSVDPELYVSELHQSFIQAKFTIQNTGDYIIDFRPYFFDSLSQSGEELYHEVVPEQFATASLKSMKLDPGQKVVGYMYFTFNSSKITYKDGFAPKATASWVMPKDIDNNN